jgi:hypothetical protein
VVAGLSRYPRRADDQRLSQAVTGRSVRRPSSRPPHRRFSRCAAAEPPTRERREWIPHQDPLSAHATGGPLAPPLVLERTTPPTERLARCRRELDRITAVHPVRVSREAAASVSCRDRRSAAPSTRLPFVISSALICPGFAPITGKRLIWEFQCPDWLDVVGWRWRVPLDLQSSSRSCMGADDSGASEPLRACHAKVLHGPRHCTWTASRRPGSSCHRARFPEDISPHEIGSYAPVFSAGGSGRGFCSCE